MKWVFIIVLAALSLNGCARDASGGEDEVVMVNENQETVDRTASSEETIWAAIVMTWRPVIYTIDKEFTSEINCWNYYEGGTGESKFGTQVLDHQGNPPGKEFHFGPDHLEYPIRIYNGTGGQVWLTCDIKGRYEGL